MRRLNNRKQLGLRLKEAIRWAGTTQKKLSEHIGISPDTMTNYVKGATTPDALTLYRLAYALGVSMEWLIAGEGSGPNNIRIRADIIDRLETILEDTNYNLNDVIAGADIDKQTLSRIFQGEGELPDAVVLYRLACFLDVSMEWLLTGKGPMRSERKNHRARSPDTSAAKVIAAVASLDKTELQSFLKGEISNESFLDRVSDLARIPGDETRELLQRPGRCNRHIKEEAVSSEGYFIMEDPSTYDSLPEEIKQLIPQLTKLDDEQFDQFLEALRTLRVQIKQEPEQTQSAIKKPLRRFRIDKEKKDTSKYIHNYLTKL